MDTAEAFELFGKASYVLLFQNWAEVLTLMIIAIVFIIVTPASAFILHRAHSSLQIKASAIASKKSANHNPCNGTASSDQTAEPSLLALQIVERAADDTLGQKLRILSTCVCVLLGFVPRLVFDVIQAYANTDINKNLNKNCGLCDACQSSTWCVRDEGTYTARMRAVVMFLQRSKRKIRTMFILTFTGSSMSGF